MVISEIFLFLLIALFQMSVALPISAVPTPDDYEYVLSRDSKLIWIMLNILVFQRDFRDIPDGWSSWSIHANWFPEVSQSITKPSLEWPLPIIHTLFLSVIYPIFHDGQRIRNRTSSYIGENLASNTGEVLILQAEMFTPLLDVVCVLGRIELGISAGFIKQISLEYCCLMQYRVRIMEYLCWRAKYRLVSRVDSDVRLLRPPEFSTKIMTGWFIVVIRPESKKGLVRPVWTEVSFSCLCPYIECIGSNNVTCMDLNSTSTSWWSPWSLLERTLCSNTLNEYVKVECNEG